MYHLRSKHSVAYFKLSSWLLVCKWLLIIVAAAVLVFSIIVIERKPLYLAIGLFGAVVVMAVLQWTLAAQARCPLCLTPPTAHRRCSKHRNARRLFGSYRLRVACSVILKNSFRCPYCGETTAVEVRSNPPISGRTAHSPPRSP